MAGTGALQFLAKWSVDRPRPDLTPWGFPSGHVLSLVVYFGLLAYLGWVSDGSRRRRSAIAAFCAVPVLLVAYSRLYLDRHWLTDLAGGLTVGLTYLLLTLLVVEIARRRRGARAAPLRDERRADGGPRAGPPSDAQAASRNRRSTSCSARSLA